MHKVRQLLKEKNGDEKSDVKTKTLHERRESETVHEGRKGEEVPQGRLNVPGNGRGDPWWKVLQRRMSKD